MQLETPICTACGAILKIDKDSSVIECEYCNSHFILESNTLDNDKKLKAITDLADRVSKIENPVSSIVEDPDPIETVKKVYTKPNWKRIPLITLTVAASLSAVQYPILGMILAVLGVIFSFKIRQIKVLLFNILAYFIGMATLLDNLGFLDNIIRFIGGIFT